MNNNTILFEVSWEVCNKVGGINTVIATKSPVLAEKYGENHIFIGPDILQEEDNKDFIEDHNLFAEWQLQAASQGLNVRIGRWNITGKPIAILVDFTPFFSQKNEIFEQYWNLFHLDSLNGQWDYIEPALFGHAAGKVIESFFNFNFSNKNTAIAHFHEWMTGTGVLYLKTKATYIATVFTTHATIMGRVIAGNHLPLYSQLKEYRPNLIAKQFNIVAKYSLERTAAEQADVFTTVSNLTSQECEALLQRKPDVVTPNGFDDSFVPQGNDYTSKRTAARQRLNEVTEAVLGYKVSNPFYVVNSGRYEFKNKGIDVFIESLKKLQDNQSDREIIAYITVPAHHGDVNAEILHRLNTKTSGQEPFLLTHHLFDLEYDPLINKLKENGFDNLQNSNVKIIFAPVYLDGQDGIFNLSYYDLLIGFDLSVFPSYYEPWGYTPMESLAFSIPTITTNLAGFGLWISNHVTNGNQGAMIIHRDDDNVNETINQISDAIKHYYSLDEKQYLTVYKDAYKLSRLTLWENLIQHYHTAYQMANSEIENRQVNYEEKMFHQQGTNFNQIINQTPVWKKAHVKPNLPQNLKPLQELANNLWWTWNYEAAALYKSVDPKLWESVEFNPIALIEAMDMQQMVALENNIEFINRLESVYADFKAYMSKKEEQDPDRIAYFSMEFGLHDTIKIFSGGLGILAGDFIKEASDNNMNMVAVGLLYRYGYFRQRITQFGDQLATFSPQKFTHLPLIPVRNKQGKWVSISISLPGRVLTAKVWKINVGRVELYLLDTDIDENSAADRRITYQLYGGDHNNRFLQELLLGVGGIRLLDAIKSDQKMYHCNEGHAAMIGVERLRKYIGEDKMSFEQAKEVVRTSTLFTTHTPVPAGHDRFDEDLIRTYLPHYAERLNISWDDFMALGRVHKEDRNEKFSMSVLAAKLSQGMNGVSKIHGRVSQEMFVDMYPGYYPNELHISYVTNGVHLPTWASKRWGHLYNSLSKDFFEKQANQDNWNKIYDIADKQLFDLRNNQRKKLMDYLRNRLSNEMRQRSESPQRMLDILHNLKDDVLTIGFARRFATYKRAQLLFNNIEELNKLVNNPERPIQFIFAGKAHPADGAGQDLIKRIVEISKLPQFVGKIIFVENYDIALAKRLISGVDVWLNNPTRPLEASGTSGEKAVMNGVLNFSVLDGWWAEGYRPGAGWALSEEREYSEQNQQDILDASLMYHIFENEITPAFYEKNDQGIPTKWMGMIKKNIAEIAPRFTMKRMIDDYSRQYYNPQIARTKLLSENNYEQAKLMVEWKNRFTEAWKSFEVVHVEYPDSNSRPLSLGNDFSAKVFLRIGNCLPENVGVEVVFGEKEDQEVKSIREVKALEYVKTHEGVAQFEIQLPISRAGVFDFAFRVFPKHNLLPHRMDFPLIKWI